MSLASSFKEQLPANWDVRRAGDVVDVRDGTHDSPQALDTGVPLITSKNLKPQGIDFSNVTYISESDHEAISRRSAVDRGDILFAMIGTIGNPAMVETDATFSVKNVALFKFGESAVDNRYFLHLLRSPIVERQLASKARGGTQKFVALGNLRDMELPLPPLPEQKRIAAILDMADGIRRKRAEAIKLTEQLLRSAFLEMFGDPVTNPKGWEVRPFGSLVVNHDARRIPLKASDREMRSGPIPYYGASGIIDHIDEHIFDGTYLLIGEDGANLIARSTPIAFRASGKFWANNHAHIVEAKPGVELDFLEHFFHWIDLVPYVTGSAQPKLNRKQLDRIPVPVPSREKQSKFASLVAQQKLMLLGQLDHKVQVADFATSLTQRAFRGEL